MPLYLNNVNVGGYLARDPELTNTKNGIPKLKFTIGVNNPGKKSTYWIDCVAWGDRAVQIERMTCKGQAIIVVGELSTSTWSDQNGMNHKRTEIVVERFNLVGDKPNREKPGVASVRRPTPPMTAE